MTAATVVQVLQDYVLLQLFVVAAILLSFLQFLLHVLFYL